MKRFWAGVLLAALAACRAITPGEGPALADSFSFEGQTSFGAQRLTEVVSEELARLGVTVLDKAAVDDAAFALELFYKSRGHAEARVEYEFSPEAGATAHFIIHEGPALHVESLELVGVESIPLTVARGLFEPAASGGLFDEQRLQAGLVALAGYYNDQGHLLFAAEEPEITIEGATVRIRIVVREGPVFRVRALEVQDGAPELAQREAERTRQLVGNVFLPVQRGELEHALIEDYRRRGYPDVKVRVEVDANQESGDVRLTVFVTPGDHVTITGFRIEGNARTRATAVLGFLGIEAGETYDSERVRRAFRELYATGLFESVELGLEGTGPERVLVVRVQEGRAVEIRVEPGWGSYEGPRVLLGIQEKNFQGLGQTIELGGSVSLKAESARLAWIDRDFLDSEFTSETRLFIERREEPSFEFIRRGFGFFLRREWNDLWSSTSGYEYRPTNVTDDALNGTQPQDLESNTDVSALSLAITLDDRDSPLVPTRGSLGRARVEWADDALASDTEFLRVQLELSHLFALGREVVFAASARTGIVAPLGKTEEVPLTERLFNGGENSVRSFREDELLPRGVSGQPLGGEAASTLNLELRLPLTGNLAGSLFFDAGNVAEEVGDYLDFAGFRTGLGLGARYLLPIGPVRVDVGWNPAPKDDEDEFVAHFSLGFPF